MYICICLCLVRDYKYCITNNAINFILSINKINKSDIFRFFGSDFISKTPTTLKKHEKKIVWYYLLKKI